ncbi:MAG: haloacid dehalogenase [Chloroflexia bacterium]|nr:haloacid dehalogenase [Chloroflexia bacterium]
MAPRPEQELSVALLPFAEIAESILDELSRQDQLREELLRLSRTIIRLAAQSIRAIHRGERELCKTHLAEAEHSILRVERIVQRSPRFHSSGYVADAQKEYAEAWLSYALICNKQIPCPEELHVPEAPYLNALGEAVGELRRSILDSLRREDLACCEDWLESMQQIYEFLVTVDYPDALTGGLRRTTDIVRRILESTRADLTTAFRQQRLQESLERLEKGLEGY